MYHSGSFTPDSSCSVRDPKSFIAQCGFGTGDFTTEDPSSLKNLSAAWISLSSGTQSPLHYSPFQAFPLLNLPLRATDDAMKVVDAAVTGSTLLLPFAFDIELTGVNETMMNEFGDSIIKICFEGVRRGFLQAYDTHLTLQKMSAHSFLVQAMSNIQVVSEAMSNIQVVSVAQNYQNVTLQVSGQLIVMGDTEPFMTKPILLNGLEEWLNATENSMLHLAMDNNLLWAFNKSAPIQNFKGEKIYCKLLPVISS